MDPSIYLVDEGNRVLTDLPKTSENTAVVSEPSEDNTATLAKHTENEKCAPEKVGAKEGTSADQVAEVTESLGSVDLAKHASDYQGYLAKTASDYQGYLVYWISISAALMLYPVWVYSSIYTLFSTLNFTCFLERGTVLMATKCGCRLEDLSSPWQSILSFKIFKYLLHLHIGWSCSQKGWGDPN